MKSKLLSILGKEVLITEGAGKFILIAMFVNIPFWGFIPYVTQALTIICLFLFWKHIVHDKKSTKTEKISYLMKPMGFNLIIVTAIFQLVWIPFFMQLVTLILLGIIYATMTSYKEK
ncbi:MAG TPA: hypothetical protein VJI52_00940 [Candidatus Nanoarchaeia archaeon]|nr:hypothetical protein [Candidatus Nanoarchaeia archaeon]